MRCLPLKVQCFWCCYTRPTTASFICGHQLGSNLPSVFNANKQAPVLLCISAVIKGMVLLGGAPLTAHQYLCDLPFHRYSEQLSSARAGDFVLVPVYEVRQSPCQPAAALTNPHGTFHCESLRPWISESSHAQARASRQPFIFPFSPLGRHCMRIWFLSKITS